MTESLLNIFNTFKNLNGNKNFINTNAVVKRDVEGLRSIAGPQPPGGRGLKISQSNQKYQNQIIRAISQKQIIAGSSNLVFITYIIYGFDWKLFVKIG